VQVVDESLEGHVLVRLRPQHSLFDAPHGLRERDVRPRPAPASAPSASPSQPPPSNSTRMASVLTKNPIRPSSSTPFPIVHPSLLCKSADPKVGSECEPRSALTMTGIGATKAGLAVTEWMLKAGRPPLWLPIVCG